VIVVVSNVTAVRQRELISSALKHIGARDLINTVIETNYARIQIERSDYPLPETGG